MRAAPRSPPGRGPWSPSARGGRVRSQSPADGGHSQEERRWLSPMALSCWVTGFHRCSLTSTGFCWFLPVLFVWKRVFTHFSVCPQIVSLACWALVVDYANCFSKACSWNANRTHARSQCQCPPQQDASTQVGTGLINGYLAYWGSSPPGNDRMPFPVRVVQHACRISKLACYGCI